MKRGAARRQGGAMLVEFGLMAGLLVTAVLGSMEMGRLLWSWNAASEATRLGARLAAVCGVGGATDGVIKSRMRERLPALQDGHISIERLDAAGSASGCDSSSCRVVRVSLSGYSHALLWPDLTVSIPPFTTALPREVMDSAAHPVCR
jgi:hypothetical protein